MAGNYIMPEGVFINKDCQNCYYRQKVESQKYAINREQHANVVYKDRIAGLENTIMWKDRKIRSLEKQVHDWTKVFQSMPGPIRRWALWRYSRLS